jgi:hypothetical protein
MYHAVSEWSRLLIQVTQEYPRTGDWVPKIALKLDNTTATKTWMQI